MKKCIDYDYEAECVKPGSRRKIASKETDDKRFHISAF